MYLMVFKINLIIQIVINNKLDFIIKTLIAYIICRLSYIKSYLVITYNVFANEIGIITFQNYWNINYCLLNFNIYRLLC